jgi:predicted membrane protein
MTASTLFQILGSLCVFVGYWLNSKNHPRQHQLFIFGHVFLICFTILEQKVVLFLLSLFIIIMQYRISKRKYKFKKDMVRVKKITKSIKIKRDENKRVSQKRGAVGGDRHKKGHIVQGSKEPVEL